MKKYFIILLCSFFLFSSQAMAEETDTYIVNIDPILEEFNDAYSVNSPINNKPKYDNLIEIINYFEDKGLTFIVYAHPHNIQFYFFEDDIDLSIYEWHRTGSWSTGVEYYYHFYKLGKGDVSYKNINLNNNSTLEVAKDEYENNLISTSVNQEGDSNGFSLFHYKNTHEEVFSNSFPFYFNFKSDLKFDTNLIFKSSKYGDTTISNALGWQFDRYFMLKSYIDGNLGDINPPEPTITVTNKNTDSEEVITGATITIDFDRINRDKYLYYYSLDNGQSWTEFTSEETSYSFDLTENKIVKAKVFIKESREYTNEVSLDINFIGKTLEYYNQFLKDKYEGDFSEDATETETNWNSTPLDLFNYWKTLFNNAFPIFDQIGGIIGAFSFDEKTSEYCHEGVDATLQTHYVCPRLPTLSLDFIGIDKEYNIFPYEWWSEYRDQAFFYIKLFVSLYTVIKVVNNLKGAFNHG